MLENDKKLQKMKHGPMLMLILKGTARQRESKKAALNVTIGVLGQKT